MNEDSRKIIELPKPKIIEQNQKKTELREKEVKKRIVTTSTNWFSITPEDQLDIVKSIVNGPSSKRKEVDFILQQIKQKISGYRSQDVIKNHLDENLFVDVDKVLELMVTCENQCYYCKKTVQVLYENVREPLQWTLDRIDNSFGHNKNNVMIACLGCNLRRRTMHTERYAFTKQLVITKTGNQETYSGNLWFPEPFP